MVCVQIGDDAVLFCPVGNGGEGKGKLLLQEKLRSFGIERINMLTTYYGTEAVQIAVMEESSQTNAEVVVRSIWGRLCGSFAPASFRVRRKEPRKEDNRKKTVIEDSLQDGNVSVLDLEGRKVLFVSFVVRSI